MFLSQHSSFWYGLKIDSDGVKELIKPDTDKMRTVQDLSSCTSSAKVFSTLDSRSGFWQIKGD